MVIDNFWWDQLDDVNFEEMWFQQEDTTCHAATEAIDLLRQRFPGTFFFPEILTLIGRSDLAS